MKRRCSTLNLLNVPQFTLVGIDTRVIVRKWNKSDERLVKLLDEEEERYAEAVKRMEFDRQLGPYNLATYGDWKRLYNYILKDTIDRIEPIRGEVTVAYKADMFGGIPETAIEKALDEKTQLLESLLINEYGGIEDLLLAELQFSFIAFLMMRSLEAFFQWKSLVCLLFGCNEAKDQQHDSVTEKGALPLLDEFLSADSFLQNLHHLCKTRKLKHFVEDSLGWDFQPSNAVDGIYYEDDDEFAPVVEMLDETI